MAQTTGKVEDDRHQLSTASLTLNQLRALAQAHLEDIKVDDDIETKTQIQAQQDLEKYAKVRKEKLRHRLSSPSRQTALTTSATEASVIADQQVMIDGKVKGPKLRSAGDVLDRLRWDPSVNIEDFVIGYLERFEGIKETPVSKWIRESTDEDFIPQHRIRWVKKIWHNAEDNSNKKEIVWHRDHKIDRLFGSGLAVDESATETVSILPGDLESLADSVDGGGVQL